MLQYLTLVEVLRKRYSNWFHLLSHFQLELHKWFFEDKVVLLFIITKGKKFWFSFSNSFFWQKTYRGQFKRHIKNGKLLIFNYLSFKLKKVLYYLLLLSIILYKDNFLNKDKFTINIFVLFMCSIKIKKVDVIMSTLLNINLKVAINFSQGSYLKSF